MFDDRPDAVIMGNLRQIFQSHHIAALAKSRSKPKVVVCASGLNLIVSLCTLLPLFLKLAKVLILLIHHYY
jgi:hypothetical protein